MLENEENKIKNIIEQVETKVLKVLSIKNT